jgi:hypothetical protein
MAITPDEAAIDNDEQIMSEVKRLEAIIDDQLTVRWHSGASMVTVPEPETESDWGEEIITALSARYNTAGWKIERQHEPTERWIFKKK